jgi:DeoR/GlpR family transcriptional regulator of sugar metabolism
VLSVRVVETVVLASAAKLNAASAYRIGGIELARTIIVEKAADTKLTEPFEQAGMTVLRA